MHRHIARKCELQVMLIWIHNVCLREGACVCSIPLDDYSSYNLNERQRKRKQEIYLGNSSAKSQWYGNLFYTVAVFFLLRCAGEYFNDSSIYFELNMSRILKVDFGKTLSAWAFAHSAVVEFGPRNFLRCIHSFYNIGIYCECKPNSLLTRFLPILFLRLRLVLGSYFMRLIVPFQKHTKVSAPFLCCCFFRVACMPFHGRHGIDISSSEPTMCIKNICYSRRVDFKLDTTSISSLTETSSVDRTISITWPIVDTIFKQLRTLRKCSVSSSHDAAHTFSTIFSLLLSGERT